MGIAFLFPTSPQTDVADMNYAVVVLGGILILSVGWYYFPKYGGVHWFTGPVRTIDSQPEYDSGSIPDGKKGVVQRVEPVDEKAS